jgi:hypothetical protein
LAGELVRLEQRHIDELLANVRPADQDEAWALAHMSVAQGLKQSLQHSQQAYAGVAKGRLLCVIGVASRSLIGGSAEPWLIGHARLDRHAHAFARASRPALAQWVQHYGRLANWVDARNERAIRWLRWLGFELGPATPYGIDGLPFHPFQMRAI